MIRASMNKTEHIKLSIDSIKSKAGSSKRSIQLLNPQEEQQNEQRRYRLPTSGMKDRKVHQSSLKKKQIILMVFYLIRDLDSRLKPSNKINSRPRWLYWMELLVPYLIKFCLIKGHKDYLNVLQFQVIYLALVSILSYCI